MYSAQSLHGTVSECPWTHTADIGWLPLALLMTYIFFFNLGYGSMIWITVAEILPIHVRYVLELPCMTSAQRSAKKWPQMYGQSTTEALGCRVHRSVHI